MSEDTYVWEHRWCCDRSAAALRNAPHADTMLLDGARAEAEWRARDRGARRARGRADVSPLAPVEIHISVSWQHRRLKELALMLRKHDRRARRLGRHLREPHRRMHQDYRARQIARRRRGRKR